MVLFSELPTIPPFSMCVCDFLSLIFRDIMNFKPWRAAEIMTALFPACYLSFNLDYDAVCPMDVSHFYFILSTNLFF